MKIILAVVLCIFLQCMVQKVHAKGKPDDLISNLLANYNEARRYERPVHNPANDTLYISFGLSLIQLLDVVEIRNSYYEVTVKAWLLHVWKDANLVWSPEDYGGQNSVNLPHYRIWTPDITFYNNADAKMDISETRVVVKSDGTVIYVPPVKLKVRCSKEHDNESEFSCFLKFGSWTYDGFKVDINFYDKEEADLSEFVADYDYDIIGNSAKKNVKYYPCCEEPYPDLTFALRFKEM